MVELLLFHDNAQSDHHYSYSVGVATYLTYHVKALILVQKSKDLGHCHSHSYKNKKLDKENNFSWTHLEKWGPRENHYPEIRIGIYYVFNSLASDGLHEYLSWYKPQVDIRNMILIIFLFWINIQFCEECQIKLHKNWIKSIYSW